MVDKAPDAFFSPENMKWKRYIESRLEKVTSTADGFVGQVNYLNQQTNTTLRLATGLAAEVAQSNETASLAPIAPVNLTLTAEGYWDAFGAPQGRVIAASSDVNLTADERWVDVTRYELWGRKFFAAPPVPVDPEAVVPKAPDFEMLAWNNSPSMTVEALDLDDKYTFMMRGVSAAGVNGDFTDPVDILLDAQPPAILPPSAPVLESEQGAIIVKWDGTLNDGSLAPRQLAYVNAFISGTQAGDYLPTGQTILAGGEIVIAGIPLDETRWIKLGNTDKADRLSSLSVARSIIVKGVDLTPIEEALEGMETDLSDLNGKVNNAIYTSLDEYVVTNSATTPPPANAPWDSDTPDWEPGEYVWRRTKNTHIDESVTYSSPAMLTGNDGIDAVLLRISSSRGTSFKNNAISTVLTVTVFKGSQQIVTLAQLHAEFGMGAYLEWYWRRLDDSSFGVISSSDGRISQGGFALTVSPADVDNQTVFQCILQQ